MRHKKIAAAILLFLFIVLYNTTKVSGVFSFAQKPIMKIGSMFYSAGKPINNFFMAILLISELPLYGILILLINYLLYLYFKI